MRRNYTRMMPDGASESNNSYGEIIGYSILAASYVIVAGILAVRMYRKSKKRWPASMRLKRCYIITGVFCVFLGLLWPLAMVSTFCYFYIKWTYYCCFRGRRSRTGDPEAPSAAGHHRPGTPLTPSPQSIALPPYPSDRLPDYTVNRSSEDAPSYRSRLNPPEFRGYAPVSELLRDPYTPFVGPMLPRRSGPPGIETRYASDLEERTPAPGESSSVSSLPSVGTTTNNDVLNFSSSPVGANKAISTTRTRTRSTRVSSATATTSADISTPAARAGASAPPTTRVSSPPTRAAVSQSQPQASGATTTLSSAGPDPGSSPSSSPPEKVVDPAAVALPPVGSDGL